MAAGVIVRCLSALSPARSPRVGQIAFSVVRRCAARRIAAAFAIPAAIAGYHAVLVFPRSACVAYLARGLRWIGAIFIGGTAWARMTVFAEPLPLRPGGAPQNEPQPLLRPRRARGSIVLIVDEVALTITRGRSGSSHGACGPCRNRASRCGSDL